MRIAKKGKLLDFRSIDASGIGRAILPPTNEVYVIEHNTGKQTNFVEDYKEITWVNGVPAKMEVWTDVGKTVKLWTKDYTFTNGVLTTIAEANEDNGITTTTTVVWDGGVPVSVTKA